MDGEHCVKKAYEHILNHDFEGALHWFEQAAAIEPDNAAYYNKCAITCVRSGKLTKAKQYAERALELDPLNSEYQYHIQTVNAKLLLIDADACLARKPPELDAAMALVARASVLDPLSFKAFYQLAMIYFSLERLDEAYAAIREAIRIDPGHQAARVLFADINAKRRKLPHNKEGTIG